MKSTFLKAITCLLTFALLVNLPVIYAETLVLEFGSAGSNSGEFLGINGMAVGQNGRIYVSDAGNARVQVFESDGTFVLEFGESGNGDGQFSPPSSPCGLAVNDTLGFVYAADATGDRIQVFDLNGNFQFKWGSSGNANGQFNNPCQLALDKDGNVYVADGLNDRVQIFDANGNFISKFGSNGTGDGEFQTVSGVAVDELGNIYVSDSLNDRVQVFDNSAAFLFSFGSNGNANGEFFRPSHLFVFGAIHVTDAFNDRVQIFDLQGNFIEAFANPTGPFGLTIDRVGRIYVDNQFSVRVITVDRDGDGLLDIWETAGLDADSDGVIDVDLPAMGANPDHKDLFLEFDWMNGEEPTRSAVQSIKDAFAAAPIDAGGLENPDGTPGINLWIDTGSLTDPNASEDGAGPGTCSDGIDNLGDGDTDAADSDCLVGDDLGGGNGFAASDIADLDADFYTAKGNNFDSDRAMVFRYAISARPGGFGGGWGEIGGNDFIEYNHDAGTIMHELGHTLNLRHGGFENSNCKPNYVSVMNYDNQFGISLNTATLGQDLDGDGSPDGQIIDFSPPRNSAGRGMAVLMTLAEDNLDEATVLDATDPDNQFVFVNEDGDKVRTALNASIDWDPNQMGSGLSVNIDTSGSNGRPANCTNGTITSNPPGLAGHDDWRVIAMNFRQFGDSANGSINKVDGPEIDLDALLSLQEELNSTDLAVTKTSQPEPVEVGDNLSYTVTVSNNGPNPANQTELIDDLPDEVTFINNSGSCSQTPPDSLTCELGAISVGNSQDIHITVDTSNVCQNGVPQEITNQATVENISKMAGDDKDLSNNMTALTTTPVDTTPPIVTLTVAPTVLWPPNHKMITINAIVTTEDICDPDPEIRLVSITSNEPDNGQGDGNTVNDIQNAEFGTEDLSFQLRAERSGKGTGRVYTITYEAEDGSGNVGMASAMVTVPKNQKNK